MMGKEPRRGGSRQGAAVVAVVVVATVAGRDATAKHTAQQAKMCPACVFRYRPPIHDDTTPLANERYRMIIGAQPKANPASFVPVPG